MLFAAFLAGILVAQVHPPTLPTDAAWNESITVQGEFLPLRMAVRLLLPPGVRPNVHARLESRKVSLFTASRPRREALLRLAELFEAKWELIDDQWKLVPERVAEAGLRQATDRTKRLNEGGLRREFRRDAKLLPAPENAVRVRLEAEKHFRQLKEANVPADDPRLVGIAQHLGFDTSRSAAVRALAKLNDADWASALSQRPLITTVRVPRPDGSGTEPAWLAALVGIKGASQYAYTLATLSTPGIEPTAAIGIVTGDPYQVAVDEWATAGQWRYAVAPWADPISLRPNWQPNFEQGTDAVDPETETLSRAVPNRRPTMMESFRVPTKYDWFNMGAESSPALWHVQDREGWRLARRFDFWQWRDDEPSEVLIATLVGGNVGQIVEALATTPARARHRIRAFGVRLPGGAIPVDWRGADLLATLAAGQRALVLANTPISSASWSRETWAWAQVAALHHAGEVGEGLAPGWRQSLMAGQPHPALFLVASFRQVSGFTYEKGPVRIFSEDPPPGLARADTRVQLVVSIGASVSDCYQLEAWLPTSIIPTLGPPPTAK